MVKLIPKCYNFQIIERKILYNCQIGYTFFFSKFVQLGHAKFFRSFMWLDIATAYIINKRYILFNLCKETFYNNNKYNKSLIHKMSILN